MATEDIKPGGCWHAIKVAPYSQKEITPNAIITYNFWREHRLIVVNPNRPRHFRLDVINRKQLLTLNDT